MEVRCAMFFQKNKKTEEEILKENDFENHERIFYGSAKTNNEDFEKNGYLVLRNLWDPKDFQEEIDFTGGHYEFNQFGKYTMAEIDSQVPGSKARHNYPPYKYYHSQIRKKIEKIIGKELFNTYYYDRVYYTGNELVKHVDRDVCEISLTFQIKSNSKNSWPIWIKTPDQYDENKNIIKRGNDVSINLNDGDAVLYKGVERPHWRYPLKSKYNKIQRALRKILKKKDDTFHHQIFFHYVLADGRRCACAGQR